MTNIPKSFKRFFWETDFSKIDQKKHQTYIIERLMEYGNLEAYKWIVNNFARPVIKNVATNSRRIKPRTRKFWQAIILNRAL